MRSMVVFFALAAVACGSYVPLAQPPHHPALLLDPHGRPLDTAEVISARALHLQAKALEHAPHGYAAVAPFAHSLVAPAVYAAPAAVSHQSRVDVHSAPALLSTYAAAPLLSAHSAYGYGLSGLSAHGHYLKKRSLGYGHLAYSLPSAVSHQSRVDVHSSPAVVSHAVHAAPVYAHASPVIAHAAPVYVAPSAVSHQSRVDVHSSPAVVSTYATAPVYAAHATPLLSAHSGYGYGLPSYGHGLPSYGHYLKKRSLALSHLAYSLPSAVSHQSRVDVHSSPAVVSHALHAAPVYAHAAPVYAHAAPVYAHAAPVVTHVAPAAVSHQSRVDVRTSPAVISHNVYAAPLTHHTPALTYSSLLHSSPLVHAW